MERQRFTQGPFGKESVRIIDGNKRAGTVATLVFLDINGIQIEVDEEELVDLVLGVAQGRVNKVAIAAFLKSHAIGPTKYFGFSH